eukprot:TRINITY_DN1307_c0_g1_i1.p1 TRINITY_DN1307_c0_g1~~TRINITY_DN1307_c0_g1_i1.p1  ORF type:complete len:411 (+),score=135.78 TRINITY_DN1307_c0_g1_i1:839-2071(+)
MDEVDSTDLFFARGGDTSVSVTATVQLVSNVASCTLSGGSTISFDAGSEDRANETLKVICVDDDAYSNSPSISIKLTGDGFTDSVVGTYTDNVDDIPGFGFVVHNGLSQAVVEEDGPWDITFTRTGGINKALIVDELIVSNFFSPQHSFTEDLLAGVTCGFDVSSFTFPAGSSTPKVLKFSCPNDEDYQTKRSLVIMAKANDNGFGTALSTQRGDIQIIDFFDFGRVQFPSDGSYSAQEGKKVFIPMERLGDTSVGNFAFIKVETIPESAPVNCVTESLTIVGGSTDPLSVYVDCADEDVLNVDVKIVIKIFSFEDSDPTYFIPGTHYTDESTSIELDYYDNEVPIVKFSDTLTIDMDEVDSTDLVFARDGDRTVFVSATVQLVSNVASCTLSGGSTISFDADSDTANET